MDSSNTDGTKQCRLEESTQFRKMQLTEGFHEMVLFQKVCCMKPLVQKENDRSTHALFIPKTKASEEHGFADKMHNTTAMK